MEVSGVFNSWETLAVNSRAQLFAALLLGHIENDYNRAAAPVALCHRVCDNLVVAVSYIQHLLTVSAF